MVDYAQMRRQHAMLLADVERVTLLLEPTKDHPGPERRAILLRDLGRLRTDLARHFDDEELGGYLDVVTDPRPGLGRRVEALRRQHRDIERRLAALGGDAGGLSLGEIEDEARSALEAIRRHEAAESALVNEAINQDIGTGD